MIPHLKRKVSHLTLRVKPKVPLCLQVVSL
jgi:hypothetical protein